MDYQLMLMMSAKLVNSVETNLKAHLQQKELIKDYIEGIKKIQEKKAQMARDRMV